MTQDDALPRTIQMDRNAYRKWSRFIVANRYYYYYSSTLPDTTHDSFNSFGGYIQLAS